MFFQVSRGIFLNSLAVHNNFVSEASFSFQLWCVQCLECLEKCWLDSYLL